MRIFKYFRKKYNGRKARYSLLDYSMYFEQQAVNGVALETRYLGKLGMPGGFVVVCDPLLGLHDALPYTRRIAPGQYPVSMLIAANGLSRKSALLKMSFSDERAVQWELGILPGQVPVEDAYYGFTADAGIGCLCDAQTQKYFNRYLERFFRENPEGNMYESLFTAAFATGGSLGCNFYLPSHSRMNVILFHTGYGDGIYPVYWGLAEDGSVCSLVIDFLVL